uniref:Uncharacterized protein n=1 Tax=Histophilus somni (strain 129Pt) TaxID=205914 RepID=Q0I1S7_HISS1
MPLQPYFLQIKTTQPDYSPRPIPTAQAQTTHSETAHSTNPPKVANGCGCRHPHAGRECRCGGFKPKWRGREIEGREVGVSFLGSWVNQYGYSNGLRVKIQHEYAQKK